MGLFSKKMPSDTVFERMLKNLQVSCDVVDVARQPMFFDNQFVNIPIWYEFKNGTRIDLNNPSLIIENWSRKYQRYRQLGYLRIKQWQMLNKILPKGKNLPTPHIVFYQYQIQVGAMDKESLEFYCKKVIIRKKNCNFAVK